MALGRTSLGGYIVIAVVLGVIGLFLYLAFFAPGESYTAHVTVINNASLTSFHRFVYIGHDIYDSNNEDKQISSQYYISPGQTKTFDVQTKFLYNSTPSFTFDVVDGHNRVAYVNYHPAKKVSNVTVEWDGKTLRQVSSS